MKEYTFSLYDGSGIEAGSVTVRSGEYNTARVLAEEEVTYNRMDIGLTENWRIEFDSVDIYPEDDQ